MSIANWASEKDEQDALKDWRNAFEIPVIGGKQVRYFAGNSLGLQPKQTGRFIQEELSKWSIMGVEGHFTEPRPWADYHTLLSTSLGSLVGAHPEEVVAMNSLTTNLHLLLTSFYKPEGKKCKILIEQDVFSSDYYAFESQLALHGLTASDIIQVAPDETSLLINHDHLLETIERHQHEIALVVLGGVNFLTGQLLDIEKVASFCQQCGILFGVDLAHATGNVPLALHAWGVDFAVWCSYKYLNAGPGAVGGAYVHQKHHDTSKRLHGWWGTERDSRFAMEKTFRPIGTAETWQLSNAPILSMSALRASLDVFDQVGFDRLRKKSIALTSALSEEIAALDSFEQVTPENPEERGAQLSILYSGPHDWLAEILREEGIIFDTRRHSKGTMMRFAPVPLYNTYDDVMHLSHKLKQYS